MLKTWHTLTFIDSFFLIFSGAAVLATLSLYTRQPMLVAYIVLGCVIGPHGFALINDDRHLSEIAEIGIMFLLFLVGLDLQPSKLRNMVGESMLTALGTTLAFFVLGAGVMLFFDFAITESIVVGLALTFSSTILGLKLLPTTALHHRHIGQLVISLLLIQDLLAIIAIVVVSEFTPELSALMQNLGAVLLALPVLGLCAFAGVRFVLLPLIRRFDAFHEYIFLIAIAWCLGLASLSHSLNLSFEIGAFTAGVESGNQPNRSIHCRTFAATTRLFPDYVFLFCWRRFKYRLNRYPMVTNLSHQCGCCGVKTPGVWRVVKDPRRAYQHGQRGWC